MKEPVTRLFFYQLGLVEHSATLTAVIKEIAIETKCLRGKLESVLDKTGCRVSERISYAVIT